MFAQEAQNSDFPNCQLIRTFIVFFLYWFLFLVTHSPMVDKQLTYLWLTDSWLTYSWQTADFPIVYRQLTHLWLTDSWLTYGSQKADVPLVDRQRTWTCLTNSWHSSRLSEYSYFFKDVTWTKAVLFLLTCHVHGMFLLIFTWHGFACLFCATF